MTFTKIPCVLMRGGTSKGLIINKQHLPTDPSNRNKAILRIYGSPDKRQIDGVGGGTPLTSKVALIKKSDDENIDIIYTFGQVSLFNEEIDYKPTCGNMAAAVGLYAVEEGFCQPADGVTTVRIYNTNTKKVIETDVPTTRNGPVFNGDYSIDGVPGKAPRINVSFIDSGGAITGNVLPTGHVRDIVKAKSGLEYEVSVIDSANTLVFVTADQLNIAGTEIGNAFNEKSILATLEEIRISVGVQIGLIEKDEIVEPTSHALPKIAVISEPANYKSSTGIDINRMDIDITGRYISMGTLHQAFAVSGGIAIATAGLIPGTNVADILSDVNGPVNIGHPSGFIEVEADVDNMNGQYVVNRATIGRTARYLMKGYCGVPSELFQEKCYN
ncbi:2-methylaconitate cis-trans isomerase PrpF family protein [Lentibacillus jeotgali]|uniref:2-methylaconitate cis-trans isomerase PrpF family protein n=1 Tax=Lentibacillus jeotgali TaxID=558169 RepID=UPI0002627C7A|nr:PrpF domain-containing protein [Lentibacillus jeotgali]